MKFINSVLIALFAVVLTVRATDETKGLAQEEAEVEAHSGDESQESGQNLDDLYSDLKTDEDRQIPENFEEMFKKLMEEIEKNPDAYKDILGDTGNFHDEEL